MSHEIARQQVCESRFRRQPLRIVAPSLEAAEATPTDASPPPAIADWPEPELHHETGVGTISTRTVTTEDGSRFDVRKIVPDQQRFLISVDFMTPLGTPVVGFNTYEGYALAKAGIHSRIIGSNQKNGTSLLRDTEATLEILAEDDRQSARNPTCEPGRSVSLGYSMGGMKALALLGLAPTANRTVDVGIVLDPGPAQKVDYDLIEALRFAGWSAEQALEIPQIFLASLRETSLIRTLARTKRLLPTASLDPRHLWNTAGKLHAIASGEAGDFPARIPTDAALVLHFFKSRFSYNQANVYAELLSEHSNTRLIQEKGPHLAGARISAVRALVAKTSHSLELIKDNATPAELSEALNYPILRAA